MRSCIPGVDIIRSASPIRACMMIIIIIYRWYLYIYILYECILQPGFSQPTIYLYTGLVDFHRCHRRRRRRISRFLTTLLFSRPARPPRRSFGSSLRPRVYSPGPSLVVIFCVRTYIYIHVWVGTRSMDHPAPYTIIIYTYIPLPGL